MKKQISTLEESKDVLAKQSSEENAELISQNTDLQNKLEDLAATLEKVESRARKAEDEIDNIKKANLLMAANFNKIKNFVQALRDAIQVLESDVTEKDLLIDDFKNQQKNQQNAKLVLQANIKLLKEKQEMLTENSKSDAAEMENLKSEVNALNDKLKNLTEENEKLKESLQDSENARSALEKENAELQSAMTNLNGDFNALKKAKDLLVDENESLLQAAQENNKKIQELESEKSALVGNVAALESENK